MAKQKNIDSVASLKTKLEKAKGLVLTDYSGLTHKQLEDLRAKLKTAGGEFVVVKNSLLKIASENATVSNGPSAALFSYDEGLAALKELYKFIKTNALPKVKFGRLEGKDYEAEQLATLAALPSKETLISQLLFTLNANTQKLAYLLTQIKK